ncbi:MAG: nucleotide sugar dehydrogenase [Halorhabdus sp.]
MDTVGAVEEAVVMGTGFIGLPLALVLASEGKTVYGIDIDENLTEAINDGTLNLKEAELQALLDDETVQENLVAQTEPTSGDAFIISVPTPLTEPSKSPDTSHVEAALEAVLPYLEEDNLINIESTIPPLTCEEEVVPILESAGFTPGKDVQLAHSPERILPGNVFEEIVTNDRIIGGIDRESALRAAKVYEPFLEGDIYYTDLVSAELCKLLENTFRDVNVALANEFALIGDELGVNIGHVIDLANNHPRVDILRPGIGVGGHCLPIDPWFLNEVDPEHTNLITTARRINDMMPDVAARKIRRSVSEYTNPTLLTLGLAYKPGTEDTRQSPAREVISSLRADGYEVKAYDRLVDEAGYEDLRSLVDRVQPDVVVVLVDHEETCDELADMGPFFRERGIEVLTFEGNYLVSRYGSS